MTEFDSPLDKPEVYQYLERLCQAGEFNRTIVRHLNNVFGIETSETSIRRWRKRHGMGIPGTQGAFTRIKGDEAFCATEPTPDEPKDFSDIDAMLIERGLNPEDWYVDDIGVNNWDAQQAARLDEDGNKFNPKQRMYQTKFRAKRKVPVIALAPPRTDGWIAPPRVAKRNSELPELVVIVGDQQAPYQDKKLHSLFCDWLEYNQPDHGVVLGDLADFPDISRHPRDPENHANAQECLQESYNILRDYVHSSADTTWEYLIGNHDERIRQYLLNNAPGLYPLSTVDTDSGPGWEIHSMSNLMRLDELGVELVDPHGTYENAQVQLSKHLAVRHGWLARKGAGSSALATLEQTGYSVIVGHTHRQSMVHKSMSEIDGTMRTNVAVEAGCMCRIDKRGDFDEKGRRYPNYGAGHPDWQNGFAVAQIHSDGKFQITLASYVNGVLLYGDQRYE
jgi:hypothetical protein